MKMYEYILAFDVLTHNICLLLNGTPLMLITFNFYTLYGTSIELWDTIILKRMVPQWTFITYTKPWVPLYCTTTVSRSLNGAVVEHTQCYSI